MNTLRSCCISAVLLTSLLTLTASPVAQALSLASVEDELIRRELSAVGAYPELLGQLSADEQAFRLSPVLSPGHIVLRGPDVRFSLYFLPVTRDLHAAKKHGAWWVDEATAIGFDPEHAADRLASVELVVDGTVVPVPARDVIDVFNIAHIDEQAVFTCASRSPDGWRWYLQTQAGEGAYARTVTWVFENGRYLFRLVDRAP